MELFLETIYEVFRHERSLMLLLSVTNPGIKK